MRYRAILAASAALLAVHLPSQHLAGQEQAEQPPDSAGEQQQAEPAPETAAAGDTAFYNALQTLVAGECVQRAQTDAQADLCQQVRMAAATDEVTRWTFWLLIVGVAEAIGLIGVLWLTIHAQNQTNKALEISEKGLARDRAWVMPADIETTATDEWPDGDRAIALRCRWKNTGLVPATEVRSESYSWIGEPNEAFDLRPEFTGKGESGSVLGHNLDLTAQPVPFELEVLRKRARNRSRLIYYAAVRYLDGFHAQHRITETAVELMPKGVFDHNDDDAVVDPRNWEARYLMRGSSAT